MNEQLKSDLAEELGVEVEELSSETILLDLVNSKISFRFGKL